MGLVSIHSIQHRALEKSFLLFGGLMVCNGFVDGGYTVSLVFCFSSQLRDLTWARIKLNNNLVSGECLSR